MVKALLMISYTLCCIATAVAHEHAASAQTSSAKWSTLNSKHSQLAVSVDFDQQGRLWRVRAANNYVEVSVSQDFGMTFNPPVRINSDPEAIAAEGDSRPKIAIDSNGIIYISYTRLLSKPYSGEIRFSRSLDHGRHFSEPITVNDNHDIIGHRFDALLVDKQHHVHLLWLDKRDAVAAKQNGIPYSGAALYSAVSTDQGATFTNNRKIIDHTCECCRIATAIDNDGVPVIMWRHIFDRSERDHALLRLDRIDTPHRVSFNHWQIDACPHHGPAMAISPQGDRHLIWFNNSPTAQGLFYANSHDAGKKYSIPRAIGESQSQAGHATIYADDNVVVLAWKEFDGKFSHIRSMRSADRGLTWSTPITIAQATDASDYPQLLGYAGNVYLSWNSLNTGYKFLRLEVK